jgi:hypothetical protein
VLGPEQHEQREYEKTDGQDHFSEIPAPSLSFYYGMATEQTKHERRKCSPTGIGE